MNMFSSVRICSNGIFLISIQMIQYVVLEVTIARKVLPHPQGIKAMIPDEIAGGMISMY
jgi:hypothetical protein